MAKDTEKLIRQLSLISYLMAERRPVTALEIRRDVEGYSGMNEDAFARRFYADRAELISLGIQLSVARPGEGAAEQEHYSLTPESFHLPPIEFTDGELASLQLALNLLDGEFAYAEPLRLALQQLSWGRPSPLKTPGAQMIGLGVTAGVASRDASSRLAKVESAIFRCKTITFDYHSLHRDVVEFRRVNPFHLLFRSGQFYLLGQDKDRDELRVFRLSRIQGKVAYATKAEHDFRRPTNFDPRPYGERADWQMSRDIGTAEVRISKRVAWQIERLNGRQGEIEPTPDGDIIFKTKYGVERALLGWVLRLGEHAEIIAPGELAAEAQRRIELVAKRHTGDFPIGTGSAVVAQEPAADESPTRDGVIRPERFARLVTLASILIHAGRKRETVSVKELCKRLNLGERELRDDINVLNVVNFGGGSYVLYAEVRDDGEVEVDPEPYSDNFARPARLLPVEAKALIAAIDLLGDHLPDGALHTVRAKVVKALGEDPLGHGLQVVHAGGDDRDLARQISGAISSQKLIELDYYKPNEDEFTKRRVEPYALINGREGWYVATYDPAREDVRHFRLDRVRDAVVTDESFERRPEVDPAAEVGGWPKTGEVPASETARVWVSPERARWERERRLVTEELEDGSVVAEIAFAGVDWLVREVLTEIGDLVVLEPQAAREAVREAASKLAERSPTA